MLLTDYVIDTWSENATTNISDPYFKSAFKDVTLDYIIDDEFQLKGDEMVVRF